MKQTVKKQIEGILKEFPCGDKSLEIELNLLVLIAQREQLIEDREASLEIIKNI